MNSSFKNKNKFNLYGKYGKKFRSNERSVGSDESLEKSLETD
jgi:hypothetical protein